MLSGSGSYLGAQVRSSSGIVTIAAIGSNSDSQLEQLATSCNSSAIAKRSSRVSPESCLPWTRASSELESAF